MECKQRTHLRQARLRKGWTIERAAEEFGVGPNTIYRWEQGLSMPYPHFRQALCQTYGLPAHELDLAEPEAVLPVRPVSSRTALLAAVPLPLPALEKASHEQLDGRLHCLVYDWLYRRKSSWPLSHLQEQLSHEIESYDTMNPQDHPNHPGIDEGRRRTLRTLALIPLQALGLGAISHSLKLSWGPQEFLTHCSAGVTACHYLAKGQHEDIAVSVEAVTAYLPTLQRLVTESSHYRKEAANLAAQCLLLKATLAVHREGIQQAAADIQQALIYAETSEDLPLQLAILHRQVWIAICGKQPGQALNAALRIQSLLEHPTMSLAPLILTSAYAGIAKGQATNLRRQETLAALSQMYDTSAEITDEENPAYLGYDGPAYYTGQVHYYMGQYNEAFAAFAKVVDPQTQALKLPVASERSRIETINRLTLAALKRPQKDKELIVPLWMAGMQGAKDLRSEQRYEEALTAYGIMEALWSDDPQIRDLRDLMGHW